MSVVMPFAGDAFGAREAIGMLRELHTQPGDELILVDNSDPPTGVTDEVVEVVVAAAERSPAHARNAGAARAVNDWILFLDADCRAPADLLDAYFDASAVDGDVGALAGEVHPAPDAETLAERYGAARSFLSQEAHLAHPYRPRAVAANLMVRRDAFTQVGGFYEGVRAAEDTDFSWRLQEAGWRLELRPEVSVEHVYRATVRDLRRQWRGYAAGRAWLGRRYEEFSPEPGLRRALRRVRPGRLRLRRGRVAAVRQASSAPAQPAAPPPRASRLERARHLGLDAVLGVDELAGLLLSNRPRRGAREPTDRVDVVVVAERFPAPEDPLVDYARTLKHARVEALGRPAVVDLDVARSLRIDYREDDGAAARWSALIRLLVKHPIRLIRARSRRGGGGGGSAGRGGSGGGGGLVALAPAALRLDHDPHARVHALGGSHAREAARRLAQLTGRPFADGGAG
ncbi:MAG: glycosyltransferase family 2 protein [Solirubrobacteraceae bacterium]